MTEPSTTKPAHGSIDRYHGGCRCWRCSEENTRHRATNPKPPRRQIRTDHDRALTAARSRAARARKAAETAEQHATLGVQPRCRCAYCVDTRDQHAARLRHGTVDRYRSGCGCHACTGAYLEHRRESMRSKQAAKRAKQRAETRPVVVVNEWAFEKYALHQSRPAAVDALPKSVVCCETEAFEIEGSGHDWDCPRVVCAA